MKNITFFAACFMIVALLAACRPIQRQPAFVANPPTADMNVPAVENIRTLLAKQLQVDPATVTLVRAEAVEWPDACLGVRLSTELCAQVITPGYKITFTFAGQSYVLHADAGGYQSRVASAPAPVTGALIIAWGGTVDNGNCMEAIIGGEGVGFGLCGGKPRLGGKFVTHARQAVLMALADKYAAFEADNEFGSLRFVGTGATVASAAEQRMITQWARMVTMEAMAGESLAGLEYRGPTEMGSTDTSQCAFLQLGTPVEAVLGACDGTATHKDMGKRTYLEWEQLRDRFAPFVYETATEKLTFAGMGMEANAAWQRAILAWARARHAELAAGRTSATINTAMRWQLGQDLNQKNTCLQLTVLDYGYAYAEAILCEGGTVITTTGDWLTAAELAQFDAWLYQRAPLYEGQSYLDGKGTVTMSTAEVATVQGWAKTVYTRIEGGTEDAQPATAFANCPTARDNTILVSEPNRGFCLLMPASHQVFEPNPNEIVIAEGSLLNTIAPRLAITVVDANGRHAAEVADSLVAELPGFTIARSTLNIAGEEAVVLDNLPGQDLNRRVLFVHSGRLYDLTFSPADHEQMAEFYATIRADFRLIDASQ